MRPLFMFCVISLFVAACGASSDESGQTGTVETTTSTVPAEETTTSSETPSDLSVMPELIDGTEARPGFNTTVTYLFAESCDGVDMDAGAPFTVEAYNADGLELSISSFDSPDETGEGCIARTSMVEYIENMTNTTTLVIDGVEFELTIEQLIQGQGQNPDYVIVP